MAYTMDDYYPPLEGHQDARRLALFADNHGLDWAMSSEKLGDGWRTTVSLGGRSFVGDGKDMDAAVDSATTVAIAAFGDA